MAADNARMNMTEGPLLKKLLVYTLPVMATGVLQFIYNAADTAVVGRFAEDGETATPLTGAGDCGYVAFFDEDENIIQLGDPAEIDGDNPYPKSLTQMNQTFLLHMVNLLVFQNYMNI
jgi:hypothetical protein